MSAGLSVAGLVLAAGQSSRFGNNKMLAQLPGDLMISQTIKSWLQSKISKLYVVTGAYHDDVERALKDQKAELIKNPSFDSGISSSIAAGIRAAQPDYDYFLIGLGDMPYVRHQTINLLIESAHHAGQDKKLWVPNFNRQRGNPVLWHRSMAPALIALRGDRGGRQLFDDFAAHIQDVVVSDPGILQDIDRPEDIIR